MSGSKRNIESLAKCSTISYTAFGCNNMSKFFYYQILADIFVLNMNKQENSRCHFSFDISLLVMRSQDFARHLGLHLHLNTTRDQVKVK